MRHIAIERIVGARLVGDNIYLNAAANDFRQHIGAVPDESDRKRSAIAARGLAKPERLVQILSKCVAIARFDPPQDPAAIDVDGEDHSVIQSDGERLSPTHAAHATGDNELVLQSAAEVPLGKRGEGLKRALQNSLRPDVDPGACGHLAVHHQAFAIELVEVVPSGPLPYQVGVGNDDPRRHFVRGKDSDGLAGLDEERVFGTEAFEFANDGVKALPVACRTADAAVDDKFLRALRNFRIEVVHEAAECGFLLPAFAAQLCYREGRE